MHELAREIPVLLGMVAVTVVMHMLGLMSLTRLTQIHIAKFRTPWLVIDRLLVPLGMVIGLFLLHGLEVVAYAAAFQAVGATQHWEAAVYLSAGSYATAGWAGMNVAHDWRVLAAFESLNGMLLLGWSTAYLFQTLHRILQTEENHPLPEGAISEEPAAEMSPAPKRRTRKAPAHKTPAAKAQAGAATGSAKPSPRRKRSGRGAP